MTPQATDLETVEDGAGPAPVPTAAEVSQIHYDALKAKLDLDQRAVEAWGPADGNLRVIAAAGSGKTTTMVALLARLVREEVLAPSRIVATTFTAKAGRDLSERLEKVLPPGTVGDRAMRAGTFHSIALRALRNTERSSSTGLWHMAQCMDVGKRGAGVPSTTALWRAILDYAPEGVPGLPEQKGFGLEDPDVRAYMLQVSVARSSTTDHREIRQALHEVEKESGGAVMYLAAAYDIYTESKEVLGCWDFDDALAAYYDGLMDGTVRDSADLVVVDEAQDNSELQLAIARRLSKQGNPERGNLILVGDVRQAIYSWRGAYPEMLQDADKLIGAKTLELRSNYRSVTTVVDLSNRISKGRTWNIGSDAKAARTEAGKVTVSGYGDPGEEARATVDAIKARIDEGSARTDECAVLVRTNAAAAEYEAACVAAKLPCVVVGGTPFFARFEVKNVLSYIALSIRDDWEAFTRVVNKPRRYLGKAFVSAVQVEYVNDLLEAIKEAVSSLRTRGQKDSARKLVEFLTDLRETPWPARVNKIAQLLAPRDSDAGEADSDRSGIPHAVAAVAKDFPSAEAFLAFAAECAGEVAEAGYDAGGFDIPRGRVTISTVHKAKGLEWGHVWISSTKGSFPHRRCVEGPRYQEELRLFYVAGTRAKESLSLTWSTLNTFGQAAGPSPFLVEFCGVLPPGVTQVKDS